MLQVPLTHEEIKTYNQVCDARFEWGKLTLEQRAQIASIIRTASETGMWGEIFECSKNNTQVTDFEEWLGRTENNASEL